MKYRWFLILILFSLAALVAWSLYLQTPSSYLRVDFLDVGQGDSILITAPNRNQVLIDGGPNRTVMRALGEVLPFYDRSLDLLIETHPDADHIGGLVEVLERLSVKAYLRPQFVAETNVYRRLREALAEEASPVLNPKVGTKIYLDRAVTLEVLSAGLLTGTKSDANTASIVIRLDYASTSFLFLGDLPTKNLDQLARAKPQKIKTDVLKVSHHGAKNSSSAYFAQISRPKYAVISAGSNNRYGHPAEETLTWFEAVGALILQTKELGTIRLKSDGFSVGF